MESFRLVPEKYRLLSNSGLKCIALVTMLIDHVASVFLHDDPLLLFQLFGKDITLYAIMRLIGRLAFPIYAFLLVEGFHYTQDKKKYGLRLLIFALISEIPWNLEHSGAFFYSSQNVFFTLFLGLAGLYVIEELKKGENKVRNIILLFVLLLVSIFLRADYGCSGFGFILLLGLLRPYPIYRAVIGACFLGGRWMAGLAFIPIAFYNGKRGFIQGRFLKLLFYAVYPLHMLILFFLKRAMGGF